MLEKFLKNIVDLFGSSLDIVTTEELTTLNFKGYSFSIEKEKLIEVLSEVEAIEKTNEDILFNGHFYEVIVDSYGPSLRGDKLVFNDEVNNVEYTLGNISVQFTIFLINRLMQSKPNIRRRFRGIINSTIVSRNIEEVDSFFGFLQLLLRKTETLRITSSSTMDLKEFKKLADSLTFELAYNTGYAITQMKYIEEYPVSLRVNRRNNLEESEAPKREYNSDLIYHYQLGLSTHHPALKFISFYHILEYYFNIVYTEKMIENVKFLITKPSFSAKRDTDIDRLIKEIRNNFKIEPESNSAKNEIEALKLVLNNYLDLESLITSIKGYDEDLYRYYSSKKVDFSQGVIINFNDVKSAYGNLANRIYKTRNAVIHSKAYERERYIPFEHESQLLKEIPLIQFIAEEIILKTSRIL